MSEEGPIVGKFETHTYVPWYWRPINLARKIVGRPPLEKEVIVFTPKQPIILQPGEAVELHFYDDGTIKIVGMEAEK